MITVASYNIHKGIGLDRRRDPARVLEVLCEIDADVVALQEADRRFGTRAMVIDHHLLEEHSPYKAIPFGRRVASMGWHGNALLVRRETAVVYCTAIHLPALEPRGAVSADVRAQDLPFRIVGMHLDLSGLWRRRQAQAIMAHCDGAAERRPTVLMGDLNEWNPTSGCLRDFAHRFTFAPTGPSFHVRRPVGRLARLKV